MNQTNLEAAPVIRRDRPAGQCAFRLAGLLVRASSVIAFAEFNFKILLTDHSIQAYAFR